MFGNLQLTASGTVMPAAAFQLVEQQTGSWTTTAGTGPIAITSAIEAGDFIVVSMSAQMGATVTLDVEDSNGKVYSKSALSHGTNGTCAGVWVSEAQSAATGFSVSATPSAASGGVVDVYLLRGASTLSIDTANVITGSTGGGAVSGGSTKDLGSYATSGAAFVVGAVNSFQNGSPTAPWAFSPTTALDTDLDALQSNSHSALLGHKITTSAVSAQPFQAVSSSTGTAGNVTWALVPFLVG